MSIEFATLELLNKNSFVLYEIETESPFAAMMFGKFYTRNTNGVESVVNGSKVVMAIYGGPKVWSEFDEFLSIQLTVRRFNKI
jgi:hypothetical protein